MGISSGIGIRGRIGTCNRIATSNGMPSSSGMISLSPMNKRSTFDLGHGHPKSCRCNILKFVNNKTILLLRLYANFLFECGQLFPYWSPIPLLFHPSSSDKSNTSQTTRAVYRLMLTFVH